MPAAFPAPADLLPHRAPMLLLREIRAHSPGETCCSAEFGADFAAACGGTIPAAFGLELIAQTAAAHHGLVQRSRAATSARAERGLLLGSRRLQLGARHLPTGALLLITVQGGDAAAAAGGLIRFAGRVANEAGEVLVEGDVTVLEMQPPDDVGVA